MIETLISIVSLADVAYKFVSGIYRDDPAQQILHEMQLMRIAVEKLAEGVFYLPNVHSIRDRSVSTQQKVNDLREIRQYLEPVHHALGTNIISSSMIFTPEKMKQVMVKNPWEVLDEIRPVKLAISNPNPDKVPILFEYDSISYIGWQLRGALPILFNCEYDSNPDLIKPVQSKSISVSTDSQSKTGDQNTWQNLNNKSDSGIENPQQSQSGSLSEEEANWNAELFRSQVGSKVLKVSLSKSVCLVEVRTLDNLLWKKSIIKVNGVQLTEMEFDSFPSKNRTSPTFEIIDVDKLYSCQIVLRTGIWDSGIRYLQLIISDRIIYEGKYE